MKRRSLTIWLIASIAIFALVLTSGCGSSTGGGKKNDNAIIDNGGNGGVDDIDVVDDVDVSGGGDTGVADDLIINITQLEDDGLEGEYEITVDYSTVATGGTRFLRGQEGPSGPWIDYLIVTNQNDSDRATITLIWTNGQPFEFSYGTYFEEYGETWVDPSGSNYFFNGHFQVILGSEEICEKGGIDDTVVVDIEYLGSNKYRLYFNLPDILPIANYQQIAVFGQSAPNKEWKEYVIVDNYPCYYADVVWEDGDLFHFTLWVIQEDGQKQWLDPTLSEFLYESNDGNHLAIKLSMSE